MTLGSFWFAVTLFAAACGSVVQPGATPTPADDAGVTTPAECADDSDCGSNEHCRAGACESEPPPACTIDLDCGLGELCTAGTCVTPPPECTFDSDCGQGKRCETGHCIAECATDGDCGSNARCEAGTCTALPLAIEVVPTTIADERDDIVTFVQGAPHHDHQGNPIALGGATCPDVFKYGYLLDAQSPVFGAEAATNPLAFRFRANLAVIGDFRVRTATTVLLDWTPASSAGGNDFVAKVTRNAIPALGTNAEQYFIDLRVRGGVEEATATACWKHHPLAAPVDVRPLTADTGVNGLVPMTLAANSPISQLFEENAGARVFEGRIVHGTAERVSIALSLPEPTGTFTSLAVTDIADGAPFAASYSCGSRCVAGAPNCIPNKIVDPRCKTKPPTDPDDAPVSGPLSDVVWRLFALDPATNAPAAECDVIGLDVTCDFAPRGVSPREIQLVMVASEVGDLRPAAGTIIETTFEDHTYTGVRAEPVNERCTSIVDSPPVNNLIRMTCAQSTEAFRIVALDQASIDFDPVRIDVKTALDGQPLAVPPYLPAGVSNSRIVWNAGDDDLPGSSH